MKIGKKPENRMFSQKLATNNVLKKVLKHLESFGFLKVIISDSCLKSFKYGPAGELMVENLRKEWLYSNVHYRDHNVFMYYPEKSKASIVEDVKESYAFAKEMNGGELPFGLAEVRKERESISEDELEAFQPQVHSTLRYLAFLSPQEGQQFFYRWQQQRKRWWRLFSADPSRFSFAEVESVEGSVGEKAIITATFPWGQHCLEVIHYHGSVPFENLNLKSQNIFSVYTNGKRCMPHIVESTCNLDLGVFTYICDAFKEQKSKRTVCMFHRKMAPFKFSFAAGPTPSPQNEELKQLSRYLSLGLRKLGLTTVLPGADFAKKSLARQFAKNDALGVPYTLVLKQETLDTGIAGLRGRDTTLEEEVHIGKFFEYGEMLMKNY